MTDTQAIVDAMGSLTDDELRAVVAAATAGRPELTALRAAALQIGVVPGPAPTLSTPAVSPPAEIIDAHVVVDEPGVVVATGGTESVTGWTDGGVPTFDAVRERIETRAGTADGATELDPASAAGRSVEEQYAAREKAAQERLAEIRRSLRKD